MSTLGFVYDCDELTTNRADITIQSLGLLFGYDISDIGDHRILEHVTRVSENAFAYFNMSAFSEFDAFSWS